MHLQNRVTPTGEIIATAARGTMMGNRGGVLHLPDRTLGGRRWVSRQWICCRLAFNGRRREVMAPGSYTELFFLDEVTALAAGHRPCFECRRADAHRFAELWARGQGSRARARASDIDRVLHAERIDPAGLKRLFLLGIADLPAGTMILAGQARRPHLVLTDRLQPWTAAGYQPAIRRQSQGLVEVLTPPSIIAAMNSGYVPTMHETASVSG